MYLFIKQSDSCRLAPVTFEALLVEGDRLLCFCDTWGYGGHIIIFIFSLATGID